MTNIIKGLGSLEVYGGRSTRSQHPSRWKSHRSWGVISTDFVKDIKHISWLGYVCEMSLSMHLVEQLFCLLPSTCTGHQERGKQHIVPLSVKENLTNFQLDYPYQTKGQHSWLKLPNDSIWDDTLLQRLSNHCV